MSQVSKVFQLNRQGFNLRAGVVFAVVLGLLIIVGVLPHERQYFLTAIFGAVIVAVSDPGGKYGYRVSRRAVVAAAGQARELHPGGANPAFPHPTSGPAVPARAEGPSPSRLALG